MKIILDENAAAANLIATRSLGRHPFDTLRLVSRYYLDMGNQPKTVRRMLDDYIIQCNPDASLPKWARVCDSALRRAQNHNAVKIDYIEITKPEIEKIAKLEQKQLQRLAFTLLCLSKYWSAVNERSNGWVSNKDSEIMAMANISTSVRRRGALYGTLIDLGYIQSAKRIDNTSVRVCFAEDGDVVMRIDDVRNLGQQYEMFLEPDKYLKCKICGLTVRKQHAQKRYCTKCAADVKRQRTIYSNTKRRA